MTAAAAAPPTGRAVLVALAAIIEQHPDLDCPTEQLVSVLDELAAVLRRARGVLRRSASKRSEVNPQPRVDGSGGESPVGKPASITARPSAASTPPAQVVTAPVTQPVTEPVPTAPADATPPAQAGLPTDREGGEDCAPRDSTGVPMCGEDRRREDRGTGADRVDVPRPADGATPPPSSRPRWPRAALAGLAQLAVLVAALAAVLLGASAGGEVAPTDVVPATAIGAALLAGLLVGRATAPAVAAAITRQRRRRQTVAPTRAAT